MGLYVFKSSHADYIKVGFTSWDNPWYRVNGSAGVPLGFSSVRHPESLKGRVGPNDLELLGWWPECTHEQENAIHTLLRRISVVGEWYALDELPLFFSLMKASCGSSKHESVRTPEKPLKAEEVAPEPPKNPTPRSGQRWSPEEDQKLRSRVGQQWKEVSPVDFVKQNHEWFGRSKTALMARLKKLGKVVWEENKANWKVS